MQRGGIPDTEHASRWLVQCFREGKLGRWTLDGLGRGGEAVDDQKDYVEVASGHGDRMELWEDQGEEGEDRDTPKEMRWTRTEERRSYLSAASDSAAVPVPSPAPNLPAPSDPPTPTSADTPPQAVAPTAAVAPPADIARVESHVAGSVASYLAYLDSLASSVDLRSAHQSRKAKKADQAKVREFKRKGHEVAKVKTYSKPPREGGGMPRAPGRGFKAGKGFGARGGGGGGGGFGGARKGPAIKLSSGRRRQYRR